MFVLFMKTPPAFGRSLHFFPTLHGRILHVLSPSCFVVCSHDLSRIVTIVSSPRSIVPNDFMLPSFVSENPPSAGLGEVTEATALLFPLYHGCAEVLSKNNRNGCLSPTWVVEACLLATLITNLLPSTTTGTAQHTDSFLYRLLFPLKAQSSARLVLRNLLTPRRTPQGRGEGGVLNSCLPRSSVHSPRIPFETEHERGGEFAPETDAASPYDETDIKMRQQKKKTRSVLAKCTAY